MANGKASITAVALLIIVSLAGLSQAEVVGKSLIQELSSHFKHFAAAAFCAADQCHDPEVLLKANKVIEGGVEYMKQFLGKTLSDEEYISTSSAIVKTAATKLANTHAKCAKVSSDYTASNTPPEGAELSKTGSVLFQVHKNLSCVVQKGNAEALDKVPSLFQKIINGMASDPSKKYVDMLLRHEITMANDLSGLTKC